MSGAEKIDLSALTPMMRQYYQLKEKSKDAILFFRMGDFYEIFGEQAELVAPKLELALTSRERGDKNRIPFCGVPHHSAPGYWLKLLKMGYRVAIADQVEDASQAKGLVKRDIIKIMSPGCIDELEGLSTDAPNYVMAVYEVPEPKNWVLAVADVSTGELRIGSTDSINSLKEYLELFEPKELLCRKFCLNTVKKACAPYEVRKPLLYATLPEGILQDSEGQKEMLSQVFGVSCLKTLACGSLNGGEAIVAAILKHFISMQASVQQFLNVKPLKDKDTFSLNDTVIRDLEIFETNHQRKVEGSLFKRINQTLTPMGARNLRWSLSHPYLKAAPIEQRHDTISFFLNSGEKNLIEIRKFLQGVCDLERLTTRVIGKNIRPLELARMRDSLKQVMSLKDVLTSSDNEKDVLINFLKENFNLANEIFYQLDRALQDSPAQLGEGHLVFREGFDQELDQLVDLSHYGQKKVDDYLESLKSETGIQSLKIKLHKTFGLVIEVTKTNLSKVPDVFIRRQTMVNCERFVTEELKEIDESLASAKENAIRREFDLYQSYISDISVFHQSIKKISDAIGTLDLLQSFAWLAVKFDYCRPQIVDHQSPLKLEGSRHPVVEYFVGRHEFVPNDIEIDPASKQILITGPNMAGKSTVMRQMAISLILNQIGSYLPALKAHVPIFDGLYTRVGASDDLSRGLSTFMVEMTESAYILRNATPKSLVILDEVGRGTSTEDGLAIASAILDYITNNLCCLTMFATHYHELIEFAENNPSIKLMQTEVVERKDGISFTHRLISGASGSSFGLEVAQLAGIPNKILDKAKHYLKLRKEPKSELKSSKKNHSYESSLEYKELSKKSEVLANESTIFGHSETKFASERDLFLIKERIDKIKINRTTPIQALNILSDLKSFTDSKYTRSLFEDGQS